MCWWAPPSTTIRRFNPLLVDWLKLVVDWCFASEELSLLVLTTTLFTSPLFPDAGVECLSRLSCHKTCWELASWYPMLTCNYYSIKNHPIHLLPLNFLPTSLNYNSKWRNKNFNDQKFELHARERTGDFHTWNLTATSGELGKYSKRLEKHGKIWKMYFSLKFGK